MPRSQPSIRKLLLLYPPFSVATSPPLGVCQLKAYVERALPDWRVRVLDLNLECHEALIEAAGKDATFGTPAERATFLRAAQVYQGASPESFYADRESYLGLTQAWARLTRDRIAPPAVLQKAYRQGREPDFVARHLALVLAEKPDAVGISLCYTRQLGPALMLARAIRRRLGVPILFGGTYFSGGPPKEWESRHAFADYIVVGGGERAIVEILSGRAAKQPVPGVARLTAKGMSFERAKYSANLDPLGGPDFSDLNLERYFSPSPVLPVLSSRGCYWHRCAFCAHYLSSGETYQTRSVANVVEELRQHVARGVKHFNFVDSVIHPHRFEQLATGILEAGLVLHYYAMAKPVSEFTPEILDKIARSGCRFILWGLESACQRVLDLMDKGTRIQDVERVLTDSHDAGIQNHVFTICGFPTETLQEFQMTLDFLERNRERIRVVHRTTFELEEHSPIQRDPGRFAITDVWPKGTPHMFDFSCAEGMNRDQVESAFSGARDFFRSFSGHAAVAGDFKYRDHCLLEYAREAEARS